MTGRSDDRKKNFTQIRLSPVPQTAQPFVLERIVSTGEPGQNLAASLSETVARRSDGAISKLTSIGPVALGGQERKLTFPDGRVITLFDAIRRKSTLPAEDGRTTVASPMANLVVKDCGVRPPRTLLRFDSLQGVNVAVIQSFVAKRYRVTEWRAPALGCEAVYYTSERINPDGTFSMSAEGKTLRLRLEEPDARLFDLGSDYIESMPSVARRNLLKSIGMVLAPEDERRFADQTRAEDSVYQRRNRQNER